MRLLRRLSAHASCLGGGSPREWDPPSHGSRSGVRCEPNCHGSTPESDRSCTTGPSVRLYPARLDGHSKLVDIEILLIFLELRYRGCQTIFSLEKGFNARVRENWQQSGAASCHKLAQSYRSIVARYALICQNAASVRPLTLNRGDLHRRIKRALGVKLCTRACSRHNRQNAFVPTARVHLMPRHKRRQGK